MLATGHFGLRNSRGRLPAQSAALGLAKLRCGRDRQAEARALLASVSGGFAESSGLPDLVEAQDLIAELAATT
jgi:predicted ATPase